MWLSQYIAKRGQRLNDKGTVTVSGTGRADFNGSSVIGNIKVAVPYGIAYNPPSGTEGVAVPCEDGRVIIGVTARVESSLEPGEIMLYSKGGAALVLKNDGNVYINGRVVTT